MSELVARCPECGRPAVIAPRNPFRPFCSERCRMLDLGEWLSERRSIPGEHLPPTPDPDETS